MKRIRTVPFLFALGITLFSQKVNAISTSLVITEVNVYGSPADYVEIQNISGGDINVNGYTVDDLDSTADATLPNITIGDGEVLVVHYVAGTNDTVITDNNAGYWDVYGVATSITTTKDEIVLKNSGGTIIDAVVFQRDGLVDTADVQTIVDAGEWPSVLLADTVSFTIDTNSVSRTDETDNDNNTDWIDDATPSEGTSETGYTPGGGDETAPCAISNLTALTGDSPLTVKLKWIAPGDDGTGGGDCSGYLVKYATSQITSSNFYSSFVSTYTAASSWTPGTFGQEETGRVVSGLSSGVTYYFAIKGYDGTNYGFWSSEVVNSSNSAWAQIQTDITNPCAISNLTAITGDAGGTVKLKWTAPGDDGTGGGNVSQYLVKYATNVIGSGGWDFYDARVSTYTAASSWTPGTFGEEETGRVVSGLSYGATYYFAIKAKDNANLWSSWSSAPYGSEQNKASAELPSMTVVINEIAWKGTVQSTSDEWIELYNNTDSPIDITDWSIKNLVADQTLDINGGNFATNDDGFVIP
ncbi:MAG: lamin tail domain-containing protein, partial [bacterium]